MTGSMVSFFHEETSPYADKGRDLPRPAAETEPGVTLVRRKLLATKLAAILSALSLAGCAGITSTGGTGNGNHPVAPSISLQPSSQTVTAGQSATFSVMASGTAPMSYQ